MLRIKSLKIWEEHQNYDCFNYDKISLHDMNLIIGANASGKTQFFSRLKYLRTLHRKSTPTPKLETTFHADVVFENEENQKINYRLKAGPGELVNEIISSDSKNYLAHDGESPTLLNEKTNKEQAFPLNNKRQSITKQIEDHKDSFSTISKIGNFFENILFLDADKFNPNAVITGPDQFIPSDRMENISSVVVNWNKKYPKLCKLLLQEYKEIFPYVENFSQEKVQMPNGNPFDMLTVKEKNLKLPTLATSMSSGMTRILCLLALPMCRQLPINTTELNFPSMVVIDEIDNGLDYDCVDAIIEYLKAEATFSQILFSSHSPIVCNFISPEKWRIFRRHGNRIKITNPIEVKETKDLIERSKVNNWEIYIYHIVHSQLYSVQ